MGLKFTFFQQCCPYFLGTIRLTFKLYTFLVGFRTIAVNYQIKECDQSNKKNSTSAFTFPDHTTLPNVSFCDLMTFLESYNRSQTIFANIKNFYRRNINL